MLRRRRQDVGERERGAGGEDDQEDVRQDQPRLDEPEPVRQQQPDRDRAHRPAEQENVPRIPHHLQHSAYQRGGGFEVAAVQLARIGTRDPALLLAARRPERLPDGYLSGHGLSRAHRLRSVLWTGARSEPPLAHVI